MNEVKIIRIAKRVAGVAKRYSIQYLVVVVTVLLGFICVRSVPAQKILKQTGFEDHTVGEKEDRRPL